MNNKQWIWLLAMGLLGLSSCHKQRISKKTTDTGTDTVSVSAVHIPEKTDTLAATPDSAEIINTPLNIAEVDFDYLTTKSRFSLKTKNQDLDNVNVNMRIRKDSLIWISVTGVGFEVARGLITRDSISFVDKFHKEFFVFDYRELSKRYNFELNFDLLQSVIIGNLPFPQEAGNMVTKENEFFVLKQQGERITTDNYISENNLKLTRLRSVEIPTNNTFSLDYEDFKSVNNLIFPFVSSLKLDVKSQKDQQFYQTNVNIKHNKVEITKESPGFPFTIPSSYTRKR
ncbi:hypothetical protein DYBT9275_04676 [Dyadobacter sp. CECT 9275]|uniref:DUF4292 domain-containing protein n=1 Tax=Dyadobacter helix TaxID=2822344 RepID=A0A916NN28_9BACT|nr:DUF4292 domain-containing protein [Dyadobacter sp. CECT 9275]CAG5010262.1 hypothetical protein DYBT9275_04676 [Dyadobacter sp. CECT 9275]